MMGTVAENAVYFEIAENFVQGFHNREFNQQQRDRLQFERDAIETAGEERLSGRTSFVGQETTTTGGEVVSQGPIGDLLVLLGIAPEKISKRETTTTIPEGAAIDPSKSFKGLIEIAREGEEGLAQLLRTSQTRTEDVQAKFAGLGDVAIEDTRLAFKAKAGQTMIDLGARGFSGGILQDALSQNFRGQESEVNRIREQVRNAQTGAFERTTGDSLNIESTNVNRRAQFQAAPGVGADQTSAQLRALEQSVVPVPPGPGPFSGLSELTVAVGGGGKASTGGDPGQAMMIQGGFGVAAAALPLLFSNSSTKTPSLQNSANRFRAGDSGVNITTIMNEFSSSSVAIEKGFQEVDYDGVLEKLEKLPVTTWNYKQEAGQPVHMGPMAEDFYDSFGLADRDDAIVFVDAIGVVMAAIKSLAGKVRRLETV